MSDCVFFPSEGWFEALAAQMREDTGPFKELGAMDCTMVVQVDEEDESEFFEVSFKSYAVDSIRRLDSEAEADPVHFYRYNQSLQLFFNGAAGLATQYR